MASQLDVGLDDIMVAADTVTAARIVVCENNDPDEACTFLAMLGIGAERAWNMGAS